MTLSLDILTPEILAKSRTEPDAFGYSGLGEFAFRRTYIRKDEPFLDDNGQPDLTGVLARVVEGTYQIQREHQPKSRWDEAKARRSANQMFQYMKQFYMLPPGRGIWTMGSDFVMERGTAEALQNCFAGDELFYAKGRGSVMFAEVVDEKVEVLTDRGWREAVVKSFGVQPLQAVTFAPFNVRSNHREVVRVTPNHRWLLANGRETTSLSVGDVVRGNVANTWIRKETYDEGFRHGIIFGDGTAGYKYIDGSRVYFARLCGDKAKHADKFDHLTYPESGNGDPVVTIRSTLDLKSPPQETDYSYLRGFIEGWLATDGTAVSETGGILGSQDPYAYDWLREFGPLAGFVVVGVNIDNRETNFGKRSAPLFKVTIRTSSDWTVKNIEPLAEDSVYCAVVPDGASFTLFGGIYTGNCAFFSTYYLPSEAGDAWRWMAEMLMLGVGVGFDTKGAGRVMLVRPSQVVQVIQVADTRQGWANLIQEVWDSYQFGTPTIQADYTLVRPAGAMINGFGGVASGPMPLIKAVAQMKKVLDASVGKPLTSRTIVDIGNIIGECVVAGNVRRSAEIALGSSTDKAFLDLKNPEAFGGWDNLKTERPWSWLSNNSIMVESSHEDPDYDDIAKRIYENGEPGMVWLDTARRYGRMGEEREDWDVMGVNPCAEQQLGHREMCTLVEVFLGQIPDRATYIRVLKQAYLYAKTVTIANARISDDISRAIMTRNHRIGLSTTGVSQFLARRSPETLSSWWREGYDAINYYDDVYSRWFGVPRSIRTTSIKPSGTISLLPGSTPGIHFPVSEYYIRRVDLAANSELVPIMRAAGYTLEDSVTQPGVSYKVLFPIHVGKGVRSVADVSLMEQISVAAMAQRDHADNMVSVTATFSRERDTPETIAAALRYARGNLKSISMLPAEHGYDQAPYTPSDEQTVREMAAKLSKVGYTHLVHEMQDSFCDGEACEIPA